MKSCVSDLSPIIGDRSEASNDIRTVLLTFGIDASRGYERTGPDESENWALHVSRSDEIRK